ncbi:MAG: histidine kinase [Bacteroidota bacterium]
MRLSILIFILLAIVVTSSKAQSSLLKGAQRYYEKGAYDSAILRSKEAISSLAGDSLGTAYTLIGNSYYLMANMELALENFIKAEEVYTSISAPIGKIKGSIGMILHRMDRTDEALTYQKEALKEYQKEGKPEETIKMLLNIGLIYRKKQEYDSVDNYFTYALMLANETKNSKWLTQIYSSFGNHFLDILNYDSAMYFANKALESESISSFARAQSYYVIAKSAYGIKQYGKALDYNDKSMQLAIEMGQPTVFGGIYELYSDIYAAQGDFKASLEFFKKMHFHEDSLSMKRQKAELDQLLTQYETEKKIQEIQSLSQQNEIKDLQINQQRTLLLSSSFVFLLIVGGVYFFHRQKQLITLQKQMMLERNLLRAQMNPHFIFNALTSIQNLIFKQENQKATLYLAKFGSLSRRILENATKDFVTLKEELEMADSYVLLESLRFDKELSLKIDSGQLNQEAILIPPMLLQPFLENSIKHGFQVKETGTMKIELKEEANYLNVVIEDNGFGITDTDRKEKKASMAIKITKERIEHLAKGGKVVLDVNNRYDSHGLVLGVQVKFKLPLKYAW